MYRKQSCITYRFYDLQLLWPSAGVTPLVQCTGADLQLVPVALMPHECDVVCLLAGFNSKHNP